MSLSAQDVEKLHYTIAHREISDVIYRLARGLDRCDRALLKGCFHPGATDDHGLFVGDATQFVDWVLVELEKYERTQHFIANISLKLDGEKAASEAYFLAHHVVPGENGKMDVIAAGRYLDRFEKRGGDWRICHRKAVYDWSRVEETKDGWANPPIVDILERGKQGLEDRSYEFLGGLIPTQ